MQIQAWFHIQLALTRLDRSRSPKMHCIQLLVMHATLFLPINICGRHSGVAYIGQTTDDNDVAHAYKLKRALLNNCVYCTLEG